ncbi:hypothetical protein TWF696_003469 [Orbilia brochopaga]|uniref:Uncharacterized protein n=1 Tax=Orbilia brochopaga TaxID=3140254 RepID=A0AAV9U058_9PEZI
MCLWYFGRFTCDHTVTGTSHSHECTCTRTCTSTSTRQTEYYTIGRRCHRCTDGTEDPAADRAMLRLYGRRYKHAYVSPVSIEVTAETVACDTGWPRRALDVFEGDEAMVSAWQILTGCSVLSDLTAGHQLICGGSRSVSEQPADKDCLRYKGRRWSLEGGLPYFGLRRMTHI